MSSASACGKVTYPTAAAAWRAIRELERRRSLHGSSRRNRRSRLVAYRCGPCNAWHLTNRASG